MACKIESTHSLISYTHGCAHWPLPRGAAVILSFLTMIWNAASLSGVFFYMTKAQGVIFTKGGGGASPSAKKRSFTAIRRHPAHYTSGHGWGKKNYSHRRKYPGRYEVMDFTIHDIISAQAPLWPDIAVDYFVLFHIFLNVSPFFVLELVIFFLIIHLS